MIRQEIVAEARTWKRTPFRHQGRLKGISADCAGLVVKVGEKFGLISEHDASRCDYGRSANPIKMRAVLESLFDRGELGAMRPGDILWLRTTGDGAQHVGILSDCNTLIHAVPEREVEEWPIAGVDKTRIVAVYRFRGLK
jgi:cell wall-associated NlpC family hydrolase